MQTILNDNINIVSMTEKGLLMHTNCIKPFYSPNGKYVGFWCQDYDNVNDIFLDTYHLYIRDIENNKIILIDTGNGVSPVINDDFYYQAYFSPDSSKILFLTTSTNLIIDDPLYNSNPNTNYRWYIKDILTNNIQRVIENNSSYGNLYDFHQALWIDNNNVICVSYSNNLLGVEINLHTEVYLKNIVTHELVHVSRNPNLPTPNFTSNSYNISFGGNYISFFNNVLGSCYVVPNTTVFQRVQLLPDMLTYGIVSADILSWNTLGTMFIFRIQSGNTITIDTNNQKDDFIYDITNNIIIPINENGVYGNSGSYKSLFSPNNEFVSFITKSSNIDPLADNDISNLYIKQISTNIVSKISKSNNVSNNFKLLSDVLGYNWIDNNKIVFTTADSIDPIDTNSNIDWYLSNISYNVNGEVDNVSCNRINYTNEGVNIFNTINNDYNIIRKEYFYSDENKILFTNVLSELDSNFITPYYNKFNVFALTFKTSDINMPTPRFTGGLTIAVTDSAVIKNNYSLDVFTQYDYDRRNSLVPTDTFSINASQNAEHVISNSFKNDITEIRWMSIKYPNLPINTNNFILGMGIFQGSSTIIDDISTVKSGNTNTINPVIGVITKMNVVSKNDVVLEDAGDDQMQICSSLVYLSANIIGNTFGHTFLWEQISGTNIILTQNTATTAYYTVDSSPTDKIFRFWIDKGKYNEQYKDVTIYATPTSIIHNINNDNKYELGYDANLEVRGYTAYDSNFNSSIPFGGVGSYYNVIDIIWDLPTIFYISHTDYYNMYKELFHSTRLEIHNGTDWVLYPDLTMLESRNFNGLVEDSVFRFAASYQHLGHAVLEVYYTKPFIANPALLGTNIISNLSNSISHFTTTLNTLYVITPLDYSDMIINLYNSISHITTTSNTIYNIISQESNDTINNLNNTLHISYTITLFDGGIIGG